MLAAASPRQVVSAPDAEQVGRAYEAAVQRAEAVAQILTAAAAQAESDRKLREKIAGRVFRAIIFQVLVADVGMYWFAHKAHWHIAPSIVNAWLGATVIQVIAVGVVIATSLFPSGGVNSTLASEALHEAIQIPGAATDPSDPPAASK